MRQNRDEWQERQKFVRLSTTTHSRNEFYENILNILLMLSYPFFDRLIENNPKYPSRLEANKSHASVRIQ
jgi:hypothetical protein